MRFPSKIERWELSRMALLVLLDRLDARSWSDTCWGCPRFYRRLGIHHCIFTIKRASWEPGTVRPATYISIKTHRKVQHTAPVTSVVSLSR